jgi:hypothetical protein
VRAFAACPIAVLRRKISDASLPASPPNSAITSSCAATQPLQNRRVCLYEVSGNARVGTLFNIVKLTKALYCKRLTDQFVFSLQPGFDCCVHRH